MLLVDELQRAEGEIVKHVQIIAFPCRGPSSIADDQFLKILPSSNYGAKELRPSCVNFTVDGRIWHPEGRRAPLKRTHQLRSQTSSCSPLSASCHRPDNLSTSSNNRSPGSGIRFVQFTSALLDN